MLDIHNHTLNATERQAELADAKVKPSSSRSVDSENDAGEPMDTPLDILSRKASMPLQEMISASFALKSNINIGAEKPTPQLPQFVFTPNSVPPSRASVRSFSLGESKDQNVPTHVLQAVASLQREVLLLRNELNFELWLSRNNIKHISRLYQDRSLVRSTEAERQGLVGLYACIQDISNPLFLPV